MLFWNIRFYSILSCSGMFFYTFFVLILLYIHDLVYSIVIYSVDSILYYRYVGIFLSVQIYSVLFIYNSTHPYTISRRVCWPSLFISILFYTFTFSLCFSCLTLFWFYSALHYVLNDSILFYPILLYWFCSYSCVWLHFCSVLFSYIILTFFSSISVQLCCSIIYALLFNYVCQVYFIYSHSIMLRCSAILFSALVRSLLSLILTLLWVNHIC